MLLPPKPLYLISGDEPLLVQDVRAAIVSAAKERGFLEKEIMHVDREFSAEKLYAFIQNGNLFSDKKIIDFRNAPAKWDATTIQFLQQFLENPPDDCLMILSTEKLTAAQQKTAWFDSIKKYGAYLPVWPIKINELPRWIIERAKKFSLTISVDLAKQLALFCEGNLLAVQQAIEKCDLLYPKAVVTREQFMTILSDHARFSIFDLSDAIKQRNTKKIIRILRRLEQTGEEPILILWSICKTLRDNPASQKTKSALQMAAKIDEMIKGVRSGDVWQALMELSV